ncbi:xylose isomerase [Paenibacillus sp. MY03]|jgi:inosose dehydratase|nr:xylose isomerase [Paenibacillus sp. MY03]
MNVLSAFKGKVAVHGITWGDKFEKSFEEAALLGYKAIEPWPSFVLGFENRESELQQLLDRYGLTLAGVYGGASGEAGRCLADPAKQQSIIDFNVRLAKIIAKCGAGHIVFGPGAPRKGAMTPEQLKQAAITINESAKRTLEFGVKSCVHPHLWTEIQDENELDDLLALCDAEVFFAPDTAHLSGAGMDVPSVIRRHKERVAYVHLKDLAPKEASSQATTMSMGNEALTDFCELGTGVIDFPPIIDALNEIGYDGWLTVEIDYSVHTPLRSLEICRDFVEQELKIPVRS